MARRKQSKITVKPYWHNENIVCFYELEFKKDIIKPGEKLRFKGERGIFIFHKWVHHKEKDVRWIDCMEQATGRFRSIPVDSLRGIDRPKRSRRKKTDV